jgi:SAM-dependent methyltransferase
VEDSEYQKMFAFEDRHWWFRGKRSVLERMIRRFAPERDRLRSLDVGCGTGATLSLLERFGEAYGVDLQPLALAYCRQRGLTRLVRGSALRLPYAEAHFDLVTLLDVLYHRRVQDVTDALREAHRVCKPSGLLVVTDSAFESLRGPHDAAVHGARRFRRAEMARLVEQSGFSVLKASYTNTLLFPLSAPLRLAARVASRGSDGGSSLGPPPRFLNALVTAIVRLEAALLSRANLPFGLSVLVVARRT